MKCNIIYKQRNGIVLIGIIIFMIMSAIGFTTALYIMGNVAEEARRARTEEKLRMVEDQLVGHPDLWINDSGNAQGDVFYGMDIPTTGNLADRITNPTGAFTGDQDTQDSRGAGFSVNTSGNMFSISSATDGKGISFSEKHEGKINVSVRVVSKEVIESYGYCQTIYNPDENFSTATPRNLGQWKSNQFPYVVSFGSEDPNQGRIILDDKNVSVTLMSSGGVLHNAVNTVNTTNGSTADDVFIFQNVPTGKCVIEVRPANINNIPAEERWQTGSLLRKTLMIEPGAAQVDIDVVYDYPIKRNSFYNGQTSVWPGLGLNVSYDASVVYEKPGNRDPYNSCIKGHPVHFSYTTAVTQAWGGGDVSPVSAGYSTYWKKFPHAPSAGLTTNNSGGFLYVGRPWYMLDDGVWPGQSMWTALFLCFPNINNAVNVERHTVGRGAKILGYVLRLNRVDYLWRTEDTKAEDENPKYLLPPYYGTDRLLYLISLKEPDARVNLMDNDGVCLQDINEGKSDWTLYKQVSFNAGKLANIYSGPGSTYSSSGFNPPPFHGEFAGGLDADITDMLIEKRLENGFVMGISGSDTQNGHIAFYDNETNQRAGTRDGRCVVCGKTGCSSCLARPAIIVLYMD